MVGSDAVMFHGRIMMVWEAGIETQLFALGYWKCHDLRCVNKVTPTRDHKRLNVSHLHSWGMLCHALSDSSELGRLYGTVFSKVVKTGGPINNCH